MRKSPTSTSILMDHWAGLQGVRPRGQGGPKLCYINISCWKVTIFKQNKRCPQIFSIWRCEEDCIISPLHFCLYFIKLLLLSYRYTGKCRKSWLSVHVDIMLGCHQALQCVSGCAAIEIYWDLQQVTPLSNPDLLYPEAVFKSKQRAGTRPYICVVSASAKLPWL